MSEKEAKQCKVVLIGESGVGKTSIINRYTSNTFSSVLTATPGASFTAKVVYLKDYDQSIKFEIWDTAGQERYRSLATMFYKDANAAIMVYDVTRKETFEELKNYWAGQVKDNAPEKIILVIAGNKSDLIEQETVDEGEARNFAKELNAIFISTSAKSSEGINNLFEEIAKKHTGATNISIAKGNVEEPHVEEKNDKVKIENPGKAKKQKKKGGFC